MNDYVELNKKQKFSETDSFTPHRYRQFYTYFPINPRHVLDVGCNTGRGGEVLKGLNSELLITGLDCVASRLESLPKSVYQLAVNSFSNQMGLADSSFDVIVAGEFIEHLRDDDVEPTLNEFFRILRAGGRLLLTPPNPAYLRLKLTGGSVTGGAHLSEHSHVDLKRKLQEIGFSNVKICGSGRVSKILGSRFPFLSVYGSYLAVADKTPNRTKT
ncbi:hypothetical protein MNBD_NITROSPINAE01-1930 [hydrothermal vent metagenome]|uniref:Methyltransferase type 11 domain-containing protein n=1 Tax=hydrothermal vent metagenome TaxID=652676 RepID=A0A3B1C954_9ZZZZ